MPAQSHKPSGFFIFKYSQLRVQGPPFPDISKENVSFFVKNLRMSKKSSTFAPAIGTIELICWNN